MTRPSRAAALEPGRLARESAGPALVARKPAFEIGSFDPALNRPGAIATGRVAPGPDPAGFLSAGLQINRPGRPLVGP